MEIIWMFKYQRETASLGRFHNLPNQCHREKNKIVRLKENETYTKVNWCACDHHYLAMHAE
jgi:hypothetical protein